MAHRALTPLAETDLFFHLKLGDLIRARRAIPFRNLFSFTYPEHDDPDLSWGFQVLVSWLYERGGWPSIVVCKTTFIVAASALFHRAARVAGATPLASAIATAVAISAAGQRLVERPHVVTFFGLGALAVLLEHVRRGRTRLLWWVPALAVPWANFHAGVFLCVIVLVTFVAEQLIARRLGFANAAAVVGFTVLATVMTPAGLRLPSYLLWHTGLGSTRIIEEFRRVTLYSDPWYFVCAALCLVCLARYGRAVWGRLVPLAIVGFLAARSVRFVAEWAYLATPVLALALSRVGEGAFDASRRVLGLVGATVLSLVVALERAEGEPFSLQLAPDVVPFAAIDFVTREHLRDRMYVDLDVGCYLLWEGWPRYRVFQDARLPAYPDELHRALDQTPLDPAAFDALLAKYHVDTALLSDPDINMRAGSFDPARWALVWRTPEAMVFVRRVDKFAALIERAEVPLRPRFRWVGGVWVEDLPRPPEGSSIAPCDWSSRLVRALVQEGLYTRAVKAHTEAEAAGCVLP